MRLASSRDLSLQVRWERAARSSTEGVLNRYLDRLSHDAKRSGRPFDRSVSGHRYGYRGVLKGDGAVLNTLDGRVAFLEAVGGSTSGRGRVLERALTTFTAGGEERWSILGLDFALPLPLRVERKELLSGKTSLTLSKSGVRIVAERWGLAQSLLEGRTLREWVGGRFGGEWLPKCASHSEESDHFEGSRRTVVGFDRLLVRHRDATNAITMIRVRSRDERWRPRWDWLH